MLMKALALLLLALSPSWATDLGPVLKRLEERDRSLSSLSAHFTQIVRSPYSKTPQTIEGTVEFIKPDLLRIEHQTPERQTVVSDGTWLWVWRPATRQAIQTRYEEWKKSEPMAQGILDFGRYAELAKKYEASLAPDSGKNLELVLKPRGQKDPFELTLILDPEDYFPRQARLRTGEVTVESRFDKIRFNPPLKAARFKFSPPKDAEVFRNFKGS